MFKNKICQNSSDFLSKLIFPEEISLIFAWKIFRTRFFDEKLTKSSQKSPSGEKMYWTFSNIIRFLRGKRKNHHKISISVIIYLISFCKNSSPQRYQRFAKNHQKSAQKPKKRPKSLQKSENPCKNHAILCKKEAKPCKKSPILCKKRATLCKNNPLFIRF